MEMDQNLITIAHELFSDRDIRMIRMALSKAIKAEESDSVFDGWDVSTASFKSQTIALNLIMNHPEVKVPKEILPVLNNVGIICRKRYLEILPHFLKVIKLLDNKEIPYILIKGGAMRAYRPERPRWTADIDIIVPEDRYEEALDEAGKAGYVLHKSPHSAGLHEPSSSQDFVDIHHYVSMDTGKERNLNEPLRSRSISLPLLSSSVMVPCPEDMVFISLVNFWKNITHIFRDNSNSSIANLCFDLKYLGDRSGGLDWDVISSNARMTGSVEAVYLASNLLGEVIPGFFPDGYLEAVVDYKKAKRLMSRMLFTINVLSPLREEIGEFNMDKARIQKRNPFRYIYLRIKYYILKRYPAGGFRTKG